MKEPITKFNFEDAFKALDDIPVPQAEKGIRANRQDLKETMKRVDKFELLFEDFYDVNDSNDMNTASEEREAEVAKAKLARIEKIVDLDAETEDDILPSYVGKMIIQCPQCMTLFYKSPEDVEKDEENPDVVNVNEVCQHCGNTSGYDIIGKVAEEEAPAEETADDFGGDFESDLGNDENDISVEDNVENGTEEVSDEGEVDELSAEVDLDELDLEADLEEEPAEEEEEANESLNTSKLLKKIEDKNELKTENESEKLTLNEDIEDNLDDKLKSHEEYIKDLRDTISELEKKLAGTKNEQIKTSIQSRIDAAKAELEAALPEAVKAEVETEELPDAAEAGMEDATDNTSEETEAANDETEETAEEPKEEKKATESLHEGKFGRLEAPSDDLAFLANEFDKALAATRDLSYGIEIKDDYIISVVSFDIKQVDDIAKKCFKKHDIVPVITEVSDFVHDYKLSPQDKVAEPAQESLNAETQEEVEECLTESASESDINKLFSSEEFKKPISEEEVKGYFESVETTDEDNKEEPTETSQEPETKTPVEAEVKVTAEIDKNVTEEDVKKLTEVTDIDEASFNKKITESLKAVYENVESFTMTDCTLNESTLVIEGDIAFKSGKTKNTSYIFEAVENTDSIKLTGSNNDLFENGQIGMTCNIINESLQAATLDYKYTIGKNLVEGLIK